MTNKDGNVLRNGNVANIISECKWWIRKDWDVRVVHVYREQNIVADWLAKKALECLRGLRMMSQPEIEILGLLKDDLMESWFAPLPFPLYYLPCPGRSGAAPMAPAFISFAPQCLSKSFTAMGPFPFRDDLPLLNHLFIRLFHPVDHCEQPNGPSTGVPSLQPDNRRLTALERSPISSSSAKSPLAFFKNRQNVGVNTGLAAIFRASGLCAMSLDSSLVTATHQDLGDRIHLRFSPSPLPLRTPDRFWSSSSSHTPDPRPGFQAGGNWDYDNKNDDQEKDDPNAHPLPAALLIRPCCLEILGPIVNILGSIDDVMMNVIQLLPLRFHYHCHVQEDLVQLQ
nr:nucleic acid binding protein, putative [Ipomoea batatas]